MSPFVEKSSRKIKHFPASFVSKLRKAPPDAMFRLIQSWFRRVPPLPEILADLVLEYPRGSGIRLAYIGCNISAAPYSALYIVRTVRPDLRIACYGVNLSDAVAKADRKKIRRTDAPPTRAGLYLTSRPEIFDCDFVTAEGTPEHQSVSSFYIRDWPSENIAWFAADADVNFLNHIGTQDIVVANDFTGWADEYLTESCLRNVARLVVPGGILIVDGVGLDLKRRVLASLYFVPVIRPPEKIKGQPDASKAEMSIDEMGDRAARSEASLWRYRNSVVYRSPERIEECRGDRANQQLLPGAVSTHLASADPPRSFSRQYSPRRASTPLAWSSGVVRRREPGEQTLRNRALHRASGE